MALWNTFFWSDGTLWADATGQSATYTSLIERAAYRVSLKLIYTNTAPPGSLASFIIQSISPELGIRSQLSRGFEAFIDRNEETQRISIRVQQVSSGVAFLTTEGGDILMTESGDNILLDTADPFTIDIIHLLASRRSRRQPTG